MTWLETNKNSSNLSSRINLSRKGAIDRLRNYYSDVKIDEMLIGARTTISWTDGKVVVICTDKEREIYCLVAKICDYIDLFI